MSDRPTDYAAPTVLARVTELLPGARVRLEVRHEEIVKAASVSFLPADLDRLAESCE